MQKKKGFEYQNVTYWDTELHHLFCLTIIFGEVGSFKPQLVSLITQHRFHALLQFIRKYLRNRYFAAPALLKTLLEHATGVFDS